MAEMMGLKPEFLVRWAAIGINQMGGIKILTTAQDLGELTQILSGAAVTIIDPEWKIHTDKEGNVTVHVAPKEAN